MTVPSVHMCQPVCVEVLSETEAVLGESMKLTCIACLKREEIKAKTQVNWYYMPTKEKGIPPNKTHVGSSYIIRYDMMPCVFMNAQYIIYPDFFSLRFWNMRMVVRLNWTDLLKAACSGMGARICKTSPSELSMSPTTTVVYTSAMWPASLSSTSSLPHSPSPRTSSCLWRKKVRLIASHFGLQC